MENIYNLARVCPFTNQNCNVTDRTVSLSLDPEISEIMSKSNNYDELKWIWVSNFNFLSIHNIPNLTKNGQSNRNNGMMRVENI